jgi:single-strand DNA-binding protein
MHGIRHGFDIGDLCAIELPVARGLRGGVQPEEVQKWEDGEPSFFDISCFREMADNVAESVQKGTRVVVTGRLNQRSWQTDNGDKRSKVEIVADDVAVSLRWATAEVVRNERTDGGGSYRASGPSTSTSTSTRSGGGQNGGPAYDPDEEPF